MQTISPWRYLGDETGVAPIPVPTISRCGTGLMLSHLVKRHREALRSDPSRVERLVQKAACGFETPEPTRTPPAAQSSKPTSEWAPPPATNIGWLPNPATKRADSESERVPLARSILRRR